MIMFDKIDSEFHNGGNMSDLENNAFFWQKVDTLYFSSKLEIVRSKGTTHPLYKNLIYPVDYGYLADTIAEGNHGIAVFKGSLDEDVINTMIIAADILRKDVETKFLVGCSEEEIKKILEFLNQSDFQKTILIRRTNEIPSWAISE